MNRRGFALLSILWLITALSAVVGFALATTSLGQRTTLNRVALTRGRWAAEACLSVVQARWAQRRLSDTATIDLGRGTRCRWLTADPTTRINVNVADRKVLERVTPDADLIIARRRIQPIPDLEAIPGLDGSLVTVDGPGTVNLAAAPREVLVALPGIMPEAVERLLARRATGRPVASLDELAGLLSPSARGVLMENYADLARLGTFATPQLRVMLEGYVDGERPRATIEVIVVPLPERLAVIRRRMW